MSALCGWFSPGSPEAPAAETLAVMATAFRGRRFAESFTATPEGALWGTVPDPAGALCDVEEPWIAVIGVPRWRDPAIAQEQAVRGAAKALRLAYRSYGVRLFDQIGGTFAFALVDRPKRQALLAVDRMGVYGLYYAARGTERLVFGSTADTVRAHPRVGATIPLQAIYSYLHAFVCRSPGTIYAEQRKLGPAQYLLWQDGVSQVRTYWRTPFEPDRTHSAQELGEELVAQVRRAVRAAVPAEGAETTGAFLSGGLDSSTVAGMLNEVTPEPANTFTIGFGETSYDEMAYAEAANRKFGTRAHLHYLTPDETADMAPKVAAYYDEPFGNSSALPAFFCASQARDAGMTCLLAGDGGDEILAGNSRYLKHSIRGRYASLPPALRACIRVAVCHAPILRSTPFWQRAGRYIARAETPLPERLEAYNFYQLERMSEVFDAQSLRQLDLEAPWREMRQTYEEATSNDPLQRMMHLDLKQALADADLKKVTGMCDLAGIDVAFPFLDDDLVAFCARIPPELHLKDQRLRAFFKEAFRDFLPGEVIAKKKHGFGMPFYEWTRDHARLRELAYDSLRSLRRRYILKGSFIDSVMQQHARPEPTPCDGLVWDLMMLELWLDSHGF